MIQRYRLLREATTNSETKAGDIVYSCASHDYGLASDDSRMTGIPHVSVTLKSDGGYPFFTVPRRDLEVMPD